MAYRLKNYSYNDKLTKDQNLLMDRLYKLRMSGMAEALERQLLDPNTGLESFETRFSDIVNSEWNQRENKKFNRLLKQATLKYPAADLDNSIYEPERQLNTHVIELLAKGDWIDEPNNLLMTGGAGAGKTYIACALCITVLRQMRTVKYIRANYLLQEADHARQEGSYYDYSNRMAAYDLLVIDDFGLMDLDLDKCRDLFEIIESRDCRKATIVISQFPVANWYQLFGNNTYADACLSRMTSKAYRLEFPGRDRRIENK
jgi:DNA replication protein DnaC